jgi:hypothetical protein
VSHELELFWLTLGADHGQKRELGVVTITSLGRLDITGPITEGRVLIAQIGGPLLGANPKTFAHFETYRF